MTTVNKRPPRPKPRTARHVSKGHCGKASEITVQIGDRV